MKVLIKTAPIIITGLLILSFSEKGISEESQNQLNSNKSAQQSSDQKGQLVKQEVKPTQVSATPKAENDILIGAVTGLVGGLIIAAMNAFVAIHNSKKEIRAADVRNLRELALQAAIEEWKERVSAYHRDLEESRNIPLGLRENINPPEHLEHIILRKLKMITTFGDGDLSIDQIKRKWDEMADFSAFMKEGASRKEENQPQGDKDSQT